MTIKLLIRSFPIHMRWVSHLLARFPNLAKGPKYFLNIHPICVIRAQTGSGRYESCLCQFTLDYIYLHSFSVCIDDLSNSSIFFSCDYRTPCSLSFAISSACVPVPLVELHAPQRSCKLSSWSVPPAACGTI